MDSIFSIFVPIHREGHRFIAIFAVAALVLFYIAAPLGWIGVVMTCWCAYFFRDPQRVTPQCDGLVISPADGVISAVEDVAAPPELEMGDGLMTRISVFMNVFNCHVNRVPLTGEITRISYIPGKFLNASLDKASTDNERNALRIRLADGTDIAVVQIAGLVARRIVCWAREAQTLQAGERFGLIRFGSRVDVYLPAGTASLVAVGQTMIAGETVIADLRGGAEARPGRQD